MSKMSVRIFEGTKHANIYAQYRPTVPEKVIEEVLNFVEEKVDKSKWNIAVDVGCGSGQGTNRLAKYFRNCYGFDVSAAQIKEANESKHSDNVRYYVSPAEKLPKIDTNSVQLLTAFEAAHWFDFEEFFAESDRILVEDGVVALIGYWIPDPIDPSNKEDNSLIKLFSDVYFDPRLEPYKNPKIVSIERHYKDIKFPPNYEFVRKDNLTESITASAEDLVGYVESWSLYQGLADSSQSQGQQFIQEFRRKLKEILKTTDLSAKEIIFNYSYFIVMGRKSKQ